MSVPHETSQLEPIWTQEKKKDLNQAAGRENE